LRYLQGVIFSCCVLMLSLFSPQTSAFEYDNFIIDLGKAINIVEWSPNGDVVAVSFRDSSEVFIIQVSTRKVQTILDPRTLNPLTIPVDITWNSDGTQLASLDGNYRVQVWEVASSAINQELYIDQVTDRDFYYMMPASLDWSCRDAEIYVVNDDYLTLWDIASNAVTDIDLGAAEFAGISCRNLDNVVIGGSEGSLWVLESQTLSSRYTVDNSSWPPNPAYFSAQVLDQSHEGRYVASFEGNEVFIFDLVLEKTVVTFTTDKGSLQTLAWSPDGSWLAGSVIERKSGAAFIVLWDTTNFEEKLVISEHTDTVPTLNWEPAGSYLASGSWDGTIRFWEIPAAESISGE
jgi:hypothetical protein